MIILYSIGFLWLFYYLYILVMGIYRAHLNGTLTKVTYVLCAPAVIFGILFDVIAQYTFASLYFWEWPVKKEYLVTDRLQRYMSDPSNPRYKRAKWICENLLDLFDPTGKHC